MFGMIPLQPTRGCPLVRRKGMKGEPGDESESRGMNLCGRIRSQNQWRTSGHLHLQASSKPTCNPSLMPGTNNKAPWHHSVSHYNQNIRWHRTNKDAPWHHSVSHCKHNISWHGTNKEASAHKITLQPSAHASTFAYLQVHSFVAETRKRNPGTHITHT